MVVPLDVERVLGWDLGDLDGFWIDFEVLLGLIMLWFWFNFGASLALFGVIVGVWRSLCLRFGLSNAK